MVPRQWLYLFGDAGVVYSEVANRFAGLNAGGVAAYLAFDAGARQESRKERLTAELETVRGLTQGIFPAVESLAEPERLTDILSCAEMASSSSRANIEIQGIPMRVEYPSGPGEALCRDVFRDCKVSCGPFPEPARFRVSAHREGTGWTIRVNGNAMFTLLKERQLGLGMLHAARSLLYAHGCYDVALHAGMVAGTAAGEYCGLLLSAPREAGKSTLAASLVARGFTPVADEPALLTLPSGTVTPLRLPISLKEGSWVHLREDWPQLERSPMHSRSDGTKIRLMHPADWPTKPQAVTQIVFPAYEPLAAPGLERLSIVATLSLLNEGGMQPAKGFTRTEFESLLTWLAQTPAYRLRYASLAEAHRRLREICRFEC